MLLEENPKINYDLGGGKKKTPVMVKKKIRNGRSRSRDPFFPKNKKDLGWLLLVGAQQPPFSEDLLLLVSLLPFAGSSFFSL